MNAQASCGCVLAIDDEPFDLMLIERYLTRAGFEVKRAANGALAWRMLHEPGFQLPQAILLDRLMPVMDGMEFLALLSKDERLRHIPVIMQTGLAEPDQIAYGIACGARYYLAKPFNGELLTSMVRAAVTDFQRASTLRDAASQVVKGNQMLRSAKFELRLLDDARSLSAHLSQFFPSPERVVSGITEILINAIEHGNLSVTYEEKSELLKNGTWEDEVRRRLDLPEFRDNLVHVNLQRLPNYTVLNITDDGNGFDWRPFLEIQPERVFDLHGRGIAMSRLMSFDNMEYRGCGNEVELTVLAPASTGEADQQAPLALKAA